MSPEGRKKRLASPRLDRIGADDCVGALATGVSTATGDVVAEAQASGGSRWSIAILPYQKKRGRNAA